MYLLYLVFFCSYFIDFHIQKNSFQFHSSNTKKIIERIIQFMNEREGLKISKNWIFNCTFAMCVIHSTYWTMTSSQRSIDCNGKTTKNFYPHDKRNHIKSIAIDIIAKKTSRNFSSENRVFIFFWTFNTCWDFWELKSFYFLLCKILCFCTRIVKRLQVHIKDAIES